MFTLDRSKNDTSVTLDLLRAVAAQMVCVGHGIAFFMPPWRPTELHAERRVLIFFLLSGILISFTLIERSKQPSYGFGTFLLERFARIYSGLVPALMLIVVVDGIFAANKADALATGSRILRPELRSSQSFIRVVKNRG